MSTRKPLLRIVMLLFAAYVLFCFFLLADIPFCFLVCLAFPFDVFCSYVFVSLHETHTIGFA